ncbi:hypothetical protein Ddye_004088 [Dipteronia dyeriana]|uniref:Uncharacterized protein n=1 Tax=Dipteronia dyeriana TaxID=168575 RepID=A0AAE0CW22_9ROSI|nr:hypothetical protein Ddye_004088 [Dipteronia dyeriana]
MAKKMKREVERPNIHEKKNTPRTHPISLSRLLFTRPLNPPFSILATVDDREFTGPIATRPGDARALLLHDHGNNWWIPDGQLCPTVPSRSNHIHWIEDLLSSDIIPKTCNNGDNVKGFNIGTGANCIYPLLSASLLGWSFVGWFNSVVEKKLNLKILTSKLWEITASKDHCNAILKNVVNDVDEASGDKHLQDTSISSSCFHVPLNYLSFRVSVFQQITRTLLVKGSLQH